MKEGIECCSAGASTSASLSREGMFLNLRREPFEYGLLPLPKLMFTDGTSTLRALRAKFVQHSYLNGSHMRVNTAGLAQSLQLPEEYAHLVLDTLATVLPDNDRDPLVSAASNDIDSVGADIDDLILFLYIQTYKRLLPRPHKDATSVADVWPSTSVFDGYLSALSPLQVVRSGRRFMPSQVDEEAHQLSYVQKHLPNILGLLAEPTEEEDSEMQVLSLERFEHLRFLFQFGEAGSEGITLSEAAPFFANSDPDMPAVPIPLPQALDWILQHVSTVSEHLPEKVLTKENGALNAGDSDITMVEACTGSSRGQHGGFPNGLTQQHKLFHPRGLTFVEGVSKVSVVKRCSDIEGCSVKVVNCHDSAIYVLAPLKYATVYGCSDAIVVLGAVGKVVRVEHCERVQVIVATARICIANCRECLFYLGVNQRPLILGDNHNLQVAPYNTFYSQLEMDLAQVGVDPTINKWDQPLALGMVDPHDSLSHPAGISDGRSESATVLHPDRFMTFVIPRWFESESQQVTTDNPFILPKAFSAALQRKNMSLEDMRQALRNIQLEEGKKRELANAINAHFKEWLYASGNMRQLYCLQNSERDSKDVD